MDIQYNIIINKIDIIIFMMSFSLPKLEREFVEIALNQEIRLDNRAFEEYRDIKIRKMGENGQVMASIGESRVIAGINSSLVSPQNDKPGEGLIIFSVDTSNLKPLYESNNTNEDLTELRNRLGNMFEKSLKETK